MRTSVLSFLIAAVACAAPGGPKIQADHWLIDAGVECGNAGNLQRVSANHFQLAPREDPVPVEVQKTGPISNYVVYVEIANLDAAPREITLDIVIPGWLIRDKFDYFLRKPYLLRTPADLDYYELAPERQTRLDDRTRLRIDFQGHERKIVATTPSYPYSRVRDKLADLARKSNGKAHVREIGQSVEGRPILSLETGDKTKPRAVFTSTFQPGEPGAWAILAMAESVLFDGELRHFQEEYDLDFIPMTNPDGVVHGSNNVNSKGEIVLLGFDEESQRGPGFEEAKVLWKYLVPKPPSVMIEFHFLTLPNHPVPRPYVFAPGLYRDPERRRLGTAFMRRLERLSGANEGPVIPENHPMWKHLVTYNAVLNWNTLATLYQNTGPKTSYRQAQRRGVEVMRVALDPTYMP